MFTDTESMFVKDCVQDLYNDFVRLPSFLQADDVEPIDCLSNRIRSFVLTALVKKSEPMLTEAKTCSDMLNDLAELRRKLKLARKKHGN